MISGRIIGFPLILWTPRWFYMPILEWWIARYWRRRKRKSAVAVLESGRPGSRADA